MSWPARAAALMAAAGRGRDAFAANRSEFFCRRGRVVAANAGGAFSPFGDITTLMVWQKGMVEFQEFNIVRNFSPKGKIFRTKIQLKPGLIHGYESMLNPQAL